MFRQLRDSNRRGGRPPRVAGLRWAGSRLARGLAAALLAGLVGGQSCEFTPPPPSPQPQLPSAEPQPRVTLETSYGRIVLELFPKQAPLAVQNFLTYVASGFFEQTIFHAAVADQLIIAGAFTSDLARKEGVNDPIANESNNGLLNLRGRLAVFERNGTDSGTSEFLINLGDNAAADFDLKTGQRGLTVFGKVVQGLNVADVIGAAQTQSQTAQDGTELSDLPINPIVITRVLLNGTPVANAGDDQTVRVLDTVRLDGTGSQATGENTTISYSWAQTDGPPATLDDPASATPSFRAEAIGTYIFALTVTESTGNTKTDTVTITVVENFPPTADAGPDQVVTGGATVTLDGSGSTDNEDPFEALTFSWVQTGGPEVALSGETTANPTFTAPDPPATLTFQLTVTDSGDAPSTDTVSVRVNSPPTADAGADRDVVAGLVARLDASNSSDPDPQDTLTYSWQAPPGINLDGATAIRPTFTVPANTDTMTFTLTVDDGHGGTGTASVTATAVTQPRVRLDTTMGQVVLDVLLAEAPVTSLNFLQYVEDGFYNGTIFHRVIPDFVAQGGGFLPGLVEQEGVRDPIVNEFSPDRSNVRGTLAMAKLPDNPDSATSEFFFNLADNSGNLDNQNGGFTVFARVAEGMDVVDAMAAVPTETRNDPQGHPFENVPVEDIVLNSATLE